MIMTNTAANFLFEKKHRLFLNFVAHTDQVINSINYLRNQISEFASKSDKELPFNYLDVGCGYGDKTQAIIKTINHHARVNTVALDPSSVLLSIFAKDGVGEDIDLICSNWEDYEPNRKFNLITSIHAFYYIDNWEVAIRKMKNNLLKNGKICVALRSNDSVCKFRNHFYPKIHGYDKLERISDELCELLNRNGFKYNLDYVPSILDIRDCLAANEKGIQLIEFILRHPYEDISDNIKREIHEYLETNNEQGYLSQNDGYVWI